MDDLKKLSIEELIRLRDGGENVQYLIDRKQHELFLKRNKETVKKSKNGK
jgi:hypothetical protein